MNQGATERVVRPAATAPNHSWSMDFVADGLAYDHRFRCLNIVDDYTLECLAIEVDTSLPGLRIATVLQRQAEMRGLPLARLQAAEFDRAPNLVLVYCSHGSQPDWAAGPQKP